LVEAANSIAKSSDTYLSAQYHRIAARRGEMKAKMAVAHTLLVIIYHVLKKRVPYNELGNDYFKKINEEGNVKRSIRLLKEYGYDVSKTS
jgi:hypothetical protein